MISDLVLQRDMSSPIKGMMMGLTGMTDKLKVEDFDDCE